MLPSLLLHALLAFTMKYAYFATSFLVVGILGVTYINSSSLV